ncbi:MAG: FKBP-type peptidyl-prolyl cis-trans isomerase [Snodgrassella sp.]|nr:FKBP-type peptidyl-prolyl cis-trans isomerase [Snodgrassella sp.]
MKKLLLNVFALATLFTLTACNAADKKQQASSASAPAVSTTVETQNPQIAGENFLKQNKTAAGVQTTASGLQYKINHQGNGKSPKATDMVTVEYEGRLIDGTVFDGTSLHNNKPATFPLYGVIPGWTEGLQLMKEGSSFTFYIPADLAYGNQSPASTIPANSTLIFDVKLIKVGE